MYSNTVYIYICIRGEVNAPINYPLNVLLNTTSFDFHANLFALVWRTQHPIGTDFNRTHKRAIRWPDGIDLVSTCQCPSISSCEMLYSWSLFHVQYPDFAHPPLSNAQQSVHGSFYVSIVRAMRNLTLKHDHSIPRSVGVKRKYVRFFTIFFTQVRDKIM